MKKLINQNIQIFLTWIIYIVFRKPVSKESLDLIEQYYKATAREQKLIARIKKLNRLNQ